MRGTFVGYYLPSDDEFKALWAKGRIIVDANVLLAVYGISPSTRETLFGLLETVKERLWIPHQFALEYQHHRVAKILEQVRHYEDAHRSLRTLLNDQFRSKTQHPFVPDEVELGLEQVCEALLSGKAEQEALVLSDPYFARTTKLFEGRVGAPFSESDLVREHEVARARFNARVPPGFKDSEKPEPAKYSDYVGWRQILNFATKENTSVILVTDDAKEDWWRREGSRTLGPRPELVVEFRACCSGLFHMYSSDRFLEMSRKYIGGQVDESAINELKERRESRSLTEVSKATAAVASEPAGAGSDDYTSGLGLRMEKPGPDEPKSTAGDVEKSEGD